MALRGSAFTLRAGLPVRAAVVLHLVAAVLAAIHLVIAMSLGLPLLLLIVLSVPGMRVRYWSSLRNSRRGDNERKCAKKRLHFDSPNV
jgi:ABC-type transport system involved in cytochrome bd biosynthesis fused ATPase/permease subunit